MCNIESSIYALEMEPNKSISQGSSHTLMLEFNCMLYTLHRSLKTVSNWRQTSTKIMTITTTGCFYKLSTINLVWGPLKCTKSNFDPVHVFLHFKSFCLVVLQLILASKLSELEQFEKRAKNCLFAEKIIKLNFLANGCILGQNSRKLTLLKIQFYYQEYIIPP